MSSDAGASGGRAGCFSGWFSGWFGSLFTGLSARNDARHFSRSARMRVTASVPFIMSMPSTSAILRASSSFE